MKKTSGRLKMRQISEATQKGTLIPADKLGQRLKDYREALGMTQSQMARRLKVRQPVISRIEEDAASSSLKTIIKIAGVLECNFMGVLLSDQSIEAKITRQADKAAKKSIQRAYGNMAMEKQEPSREAYKNQLKKSIEELIDKPGPELWEE